MKQMIFNGFPSFLMGWQMLQMLPIVFRGVSAEFEVSKELASIDNLRGITTGKNIVKENTNSEQSEGKSAKMCYNWWWLKYVLSKKKKKA